MGDSQRHVDDVTDGPPAELEQRREALETRLQVAKEGKEPLRGEAEVVR